MRRLHTAFIGLALTLGLAACSGSNEEPAGVLTEAQEQALKKAEDLEQMLLDKQQEVLKDIDSQKP
ncbi:MAG: hypothetical protein ACI9DH_000602 [Halioglobus sp.]|jgi:hypothetical protein